MMFLQLLLFYKIHQH